MISGFRKPKRSGNIRKKVLTDNDEDNEASEKRSALVIDVSSTTAGVCEKERAKSKDKSKKSSKPAGLLSFEDDIDSGDIFQVKKSKESKLLAKRLESSKKTKKKVVEEVGEVGAEVNIKKEEAILPVLKSNTIPPENKKEKKSERSSFADLKKKSDDGTDDTIPSIRAGLNSGLIPDAATIFAVKKKREQARQLGGGADFIPVVSKETSKYEGRFANSKSRLVREEDEDDSDEDRMEFKGNTVKSFPALERRSQVAKALEEAQDVDENDYNEEDEVTLWEKEQIKKGTGIPAGQTEAAYGPQIPTDYGSSVQFETPVVTPEQYFAGSIHQSTMSSNSMATVQSYQNSTPNLLATVATRDGYPENSFISVDMVTQKLSERLSSVEQVHRAHKLEKEKIDSDLKTSKDSIAALERNTAELSDKFSFYQNIQGYFEDFVECMNEKVPKINECEKLMHLLWRVRAEKFLKRRADDVKDQDSEVLGKSSKHSSSDYGHERAEFEENARKRRVAEREGRRNRRRKQREKTFSSKDLSAYNEGMSSDDEELDGDVLRFEKDKAKVLEQANEIFDDVVEDFSSLSEVHSRFIQWRLGFQDSYKEAFADLSLPKVAAPFIRLELLSWNPLEETSTGIESMVWYRTLKNSGDYKGKSLKEENEHFQRLSLVVEKVLLPKLLVFVESVWDPLSTKQTECLATCIATILDKYPTITDISNQKKELLNVILMRLRNTSESGIFLPLYGKSKSSSALSFLKRQFWTSFKLLKNTLLWLGTLSEKEVQQITVDGILNRYLIAALQQFPNLHENSEICRTIISVLPKVWFENNTESLLSGMEPFSRYLVSLAGAIYKSSLGYSITEKKKAKLATKRIISLLMHMSAFDLARSVAVDFKYELS